MASLTGWGPFSLQQFLNLEVGDTVCDMHYGMHGLEQIMPKGLKIINHVTFPSGCGPLFITETTSKMYHNKLGVVVKSPSMTPHGAIATIAYSYDARTFGVFQLSSEERNV